MQNKSVRHYKAAGICMLLCTLWQAGYPVLLAIAHNQFVKAGELLRATGGQPGWEDQARLKNLQDSWATLNWTVESLRRPALDVVFWVLIAAVLVAFLFIYGRKWTAATVALSLAVSLPAAWLVAFTLGKVQGFSTTSEVRIMGVATVVGSVLALALAFFIHWLAIRVKRKSRGEEAQ